MTKEQENKIIRCLKISKMQGGGQLLNILTDNAKAWNHEVSKYLQKLKRKGFVMYFETTKVWYWLDEVNENEIFNLKR